MDTRKSSKNFNIINLSSEQNDSFYLMAQESFEGAFEKLFHTKSFGSGSD